MSVRISDNNTQQSSSKPISTGLLDILPTDQEGTAKAREPEGRIVENLNQMAVEHANQLKEEWITATAEEQKKAENTKEKEQPVRDKRDNASLSDKSRFYNMTPEQLQKAIKNWVLEMEAKLWNELLNWMPPSNHTSLQESLKQLQFLFLSLQEAVYKNTEGDAAMIQLTRLNQALSTALNQVYDGKLHHLTGFFQQYGTQESVSTLKSSLYQAASGSSLPEKELEQFWQMGKSRESFTFSTASPYKESFSQSGMIYQPNGKGKILQNQQYQAQLRTESGTHMVKGKAGQFSYLSSAARLYQPQDIEQAESFAKYINHNGNLFKNYHSHSIGQEMMGVLAGAMSIKAQVYLEQLQLAPPMRTSLQSAVDKMIDYYLNRPDFKPDSGKAGSAFDIRLAYKVYYQMQEMYHTTNRPQNAIFRGIQYALELFLKKSQHDLQTGTKVELESSVPTEQAEISFYREKNMIAQWEAGKKQLEQDWKKFLKSLKKESHKPLPTQLIEHSLWGALMKPETGFTHKSARYWFGVLMGIIAVVIAGLLFIQS